MPTRCKDPSMEGIMDQLPVDVDFSPYAGRWVAVINGRIVAQGGTPEQASLAAQLSRPKEIPQVYSIPMRNPLIFHPILARVRQALPSETRVYLVGGAVRDSILGRPVHDFDFVLSGNALGIARRVANHIQGAYFPLDEARATGRVIATGEDGDRLVLDFAALRGPDLEADLRDRDFTVNAIAVDISRPQEILDPLGGVTDLWHKELRSCSEESFIQDPLRVLRAIRLAAGLGFRIQPATRERMREAVSSLVQISPERLRDEILRTLGGPQPHTALRALDMMGVLPLVLPELSALKGVDQSPPHIQPVWEHTLDTLKNLSHLLDVFIARHDPDNALGLVLGLGVIHLGRYRQQIREHLTQEIVTDRDLRALLFLAALYHDIAKPLTRQVESGGRIRFFDHDQAGSDMVAVRATALHLSRREIDRLALIVRHHMRPTHLAREEWLPTRRSIYRFFRDTGKAGIDICLLSLADLLATYGNTLPPERWTRQLDVVRLLMEAWWEQPQEKVRPAAILTGRDLIEEFHLQPGPIIGELLESVREAQATGQVASRQAALELVESLLNT